MKKEVGLWIDHNETVFVTIENDVEVIRKIKSNVNKSDVSGTNEMNNSVFLQHLNQYYDGVISFIRNANSILIFGPGKAKTEFKKRLIMSELGEHIVGVENVGKMTEKQISAKVVNFYMGH